MLWRDGIPLLGCSKVDVVDTVKVHIFCVPGKCGFPHPEVQVSSVNSFDMNAIVITNVVQNSAKLIDVPDTLVFIIQTARDICTIYWGNKCNVFPIFSFQFLIIIVLWRPESVTIPINTYMTRKPKKLCTISHLAQFPWFYKIHSCHMTISDLWWSFICPLTEGWWLSYNWFSMSIATFCDHEDSDLWKLQNVIMLYKVCFGALFLTSIMKPLHTPVKTNYVPSPSSKSLLGPTTSQSSHISVESF